MARNTQLIELRNKKISKRFETLSEKKTDKGKRKYTYDYILEELSKEFYLEPATIMKILKK